MSISVRRGEAGGSVCSRGGCTLGEGEKEGGRGVVDKQNGQVSAITSVVYQLLATLELCATEDEVAAPSTYINYTHLFI